MSLLSSTMKISQGIETTLICFRSSHFIPVIAAFQEGGSVTKVKETAMILTMAGNGACEVSG
jgi:hypothetical protein